MATRGGARVPRCGLVFLNPRLTAEAYGRFYDGIYRPLVSAFHGRLIDARTIQAEQRDYARRAREFIRPFIAERTPGRLLDIGARREWSAHFARNSGWSGTRHRSRPA
jgi:hypothetical protein